MNNTAMCKFSAINQSIENAHRIVAVFERSFSNVCQQNFKSEQNFPLLTRN